MFHSPFCIIILSVLLWYKNWFSRHLLHCRLVTASSVQQKNSHPFKGRESSFPVLPPLFTIHLHALPHQVLVSYLCTITGAPVASYPRLIHPPLQREAPGGIHVCLPPRLSSAGCFLWILCSHYFFLSSLFHTGILCRELPIVKYKNHFGSIFRKYAAQFPPITFTASCGFIPLCRSAAVSSGTWLWFTRQSPWLSLYSNFGSASP